MLLNLLIEQNPWWSNTKFKENVGHIRPKYLEKIKKQNETRAISILSGIRRCGKSTLLFQNIRHLIEKGHPVKNILYFNFFYIYEAQLSPEILDKIYTEYTEHMNPNLKKVIYLFLDEIQEVNHFESWVLKKNELGKSKIKIFLTGSSSNLTSSEIGSKFTGRNITTLVRPLDFEEFILFKEPNFTKKIKDRSYLSLKKHEQKIQKLLKDYMREGGFPEIVLTPQNRNELLASYMQDIIYRDVIKPFGFEKAIQLEDLANYLLSIASNLFSYRRIENTVGISHETVRKYIAAFERSQLYKRLTPFSISKLIKVAKNVNHKIYIADHSFIGAQSHDFQSNLGVIAENIMCNHFYERYKNSLGFYRNENSEIDFVYIDKSNTYLTQITFTDEIRENEIKSLLINQGKFKNPQNLIITKNLYGNKTVDGVKIEFRPLWLILLNKT